MLYKKYLALIFTSLADYCRTGAPRCQPGFPPKIPRHEKLKGWSKSNLSLAIHRETICNHQRYSPNLVGAMEKSVAPLVFRERESSFKQNGHPFHPQWNAS